MASHFRMIWASVSRRLRRLERQLRITEGRRRSYAWGLPIGAVVLCVTVLVVAGLVSHMSPIEYVPIALFESLVMGGLFVACMMPVAPPRNDRGDWRPDGDPTPPTVDPRVWIDLLADGEMGGRPAASLTEELPRELTGTRH